MCLGIQPLKSASFLSRDPLWREPFEKPHDKCFFSTTANLVVTHARLTHPTLQMELRSLDNRPIDYPSRTVSLFDSLLLNFLVAQFSTRSAVSARNQEESLWRRPEEQKSRKKNSKIISRFDTASITCSCSSSSRKIWRRSWWITSIKSLVWNPDSGSLFM